MTGVNRTTRANRQLGWALAFIAGATNAGAFLAVKQYTSHMTGIASTMADHVALGEFQLAAGAIGALGSFLSGAAISAILINYARRCKLKSQFALPLLLEGLLLLCFGILGAQLADIQGFFVSATIMLLCFTMGLQNALITKISSAEIRTTHVTGLVTDIGIELGKLVYWNRAQEAALPPVTADRDRLVLLSVLFLAFLLGGIMGAVGFQRIGYTTTIPLAVVLFLMAIVPVTDDVRGYFSKKNA